MRIKTYFYCSACNQQNYFSTKNKTKSKNEKLTLNKFCNNCRQIHSHNEKAK